MKRILAVLFLAAVPAAASVITNPNGSGGSGGNTGLVSFSTGMLNYTTASSVTINNTLTVGGTGNTSSQFTYFGTTYTVLSSSFTAPPIGDRAVFTSSNGTLGDGGPNISGVLVLPLPSGDTTYAALAATQTLTGSLTLDSSITVNNLHSITTSSNVGVNLGGSLLVQSSTTLTASTNTATFVAVSSPGATGPYDVAITTNGHIVTWGPLPQLTGCGSGSPVLDGNANDQGGKFTTGTGTPTSCTLTFATPYASTNCTVVCNGNTSSSTASVYVASTTATSATFDFTAGLTSTVINYQCKGTGYGCATGE